MDVPVVPIVRARIIEAEFRRELTCVDTWQAEFAGVLCYPLLARAAPSCMFSRSCENDNDTCITLERFPPSHATRHVDVGGRNLQFSEKRVEQGVFPHDHVARFQFVADAEQAHVAHDRRLIADGEVARIDAMFYCLRRETRDIAAVLYRNRGAENPDALPPGYHIRNQIRSIQKLPPANACPRGCASAARTRSGNLQNA